jgi:hypothetical protein
VCLLGAFFGLLTCALTIYERVRPSAPRAALAVNAAGAAPATGAVNATGAVAEPS